MVLTFFEDPDSLGFTPEQLSNNLALGRPTTASSTEAGLAVAGGYVGDGVATAHLAGRTLAELIVGLDTERTTLPWVSHEWPSWEVEPFRWIGINAGLAMARRADRSEEHRNKPSKLSDVGNWLRGKRR